MGYYKNKSKHNPKKHYSPVSPYEKPICRQLRAYLAMNSPILIPEGYYFIFHNKLTYYDTILNISGRLATAEELTDISKYLYVNDCALCPMLVWSKIEEEPILVRLKPGSKEPVKIIRNPSTYRQAYAIYISHEKEMDGKA